jgi:Rha family phage regulatory protein
MELNEISQNKITSLEVAEMIEKDHKNVLRDIRGYSGELGKLKIEPTDFFIESTYQSGQNKELPCYLVTKKGCEFIGHKLTGTKGTEFTAKYINRFHDMESAIEHASHNLSMPLQMFKSLFDAAAQQEIRSKQIEAKADKALKTVNAIRETIISEMDDWRTEIKHLVSSIQRGSNKSYPDTWNMLYDELEKRGRCDLSVRVNNGRFRLREIGASKSTVDNYRPMDAIEADTRLKEIFTAIVKEYSIKYVA